MSGAGAPGSVHGHVILRWLAAQAMDLETLRTRADALLGRDARFHTCDTVDLDLDALVSLLAERGKIVRDGEGWRSDLAKVCADE
jgi:probable metal-binding protein